MVCEIDYEEKCTETEGDETNYHNFEDEFVCPDCSDINYIGEEGFSCKNCGSFYNFCDCPNQEPIDLINWKKILKGFVSLDTKPN